LADYADWTESIELLGSEIMVPIDLQGAYAMMPVDIQAQYITLQTDIVAQSVGNIGIDIKAQTLSQLNVNITGSAATLNVNISSQSVTVNMNISTQSVAVKSQGEWAPQAGQQKYLSSGLTGADIEANTAATIFNYAVTSGKTFYITYASFMAWDMATGTPAGLPVGMSIADYDPSTGIIVRLVFLGGNGGGGISFPTPVKVAGGHQIYVQGFNPCEMTLRFLASFGGYEL